MVNLRSGKSMSTSIVVQGGRGASSLGRFVLVDEISFVAPIQVFPAHSENLLLVSHPRIAHDHQCVAKRLFAKRQKLGFYFGINDALPCALFRTSEQQLAVKTISRRKFAATATVVGAGAVLDAPAFVFAAIDYPKTKPAMRALGKSTFKLPR